jgi:hypothetical protein
VITLLIFVILLPFALVILLGAPYLPTRKQQAEQALKLLDLKPGQVFIDLGCGDGVMLVHAAKRGLICYGYELNPLVWLVARVRTYRNRDSVHVYLKNYWKVELPKADGIYVFLLDKYMKKLDEKLKREATGARLISYTFKIPGKKIIKTKDALNLYQY